MSLGAGYYVFLGDITFSCLCPGSTSLGYLVEIEAARFFYYNVTTSFLLSSVLHWIKIMFSLLRCLYRGGEFISILYWLIDLNLDSWMPILFFGLSSNTIAIYLTTLKHFLFLFYFSLSLPPSLSVLSFPSAFSSLFLSNKGSPVSLAALELCM